ncbi:MAG: prefoldin subunit beta [Methanobacteriota archaeon]|nr:MAG: prefoldin subunit beta [Euryarchaeota archaeon]
MAEIPKNLEQQLLQFQQVQSQAQAIVQQRLQLELQLRETERALEEMAKLDEKAEVYKSVGAYLIRSEKEVLTKELEEKKETLEVRIKTFKKQEEKYTEQLKSMKTDIEGQLKGFQPSAG